MNDNAWDSDGPFSLSGKNLRALRALSYLTPLAVDSEKHVRSGGASACCRWNKAHYQATRERQPRLETCPRVQPGGLQSSSINRAHVKRGRSCALICQSALSLRLF